MRVFYASFWRRFWAFVLDGVVVLCAWGTFAALTEGGNTGALLALFYVVYMVGLTMEGGTIGKRMLQLRVVRSNGDPVEGVRAAVRELAGKPISTVCFCLGFLWMLDDSMRRTWHDRFADTIVVRELPSVLGPEWHAAPPWKRETMVAASEPSSTPE